MSTIVKPDQENQEDSSQSTPEPIQPTSPTENSPTELDSIKRQLEDAKRREQLMLDALRSSNEVVTRQNEELENSRRPREPEKTTEELTKEYYADPVGMMSKMLDEKLERTVAPLREQFNRANAVSALDGLVNKFKSDPRFSSQWDSAVEQYVRTEAGKIDNINEQTFGVIVLSTLGMKVANLLPGSTPPRQPDPRPMNNRNDDRVIPPNVPVSRGNPPVPDSRTKRRELTEEERRLAREYKMSDDDYLDFMDMDKREVVKTAVGKRA